MRVKARKNAGKEYGKKMVQKDSKSLAQLSRSETFQPRMNTDKRMQARSLEELQILRLQGWVIAVTRRSTTASGRRRAGGEQVICQ
jgi:hypothetical protein